MSGKEGNDPYSEIASNEIAKEEAWKIPGFFL